MELEDVFEFGKFKGLSLKEVYQGTQNIDKILVKDFLVSKIPYFSKGSGVYYDMARKSSFEVLKDRIIVKSDIEDKRRLVGMLTVLFANGLSYKDVQQGISRLSDFRAAISEHCYDNSVIDGNPGYISWCMETVPNFFILEDDLLELENLDVNIFKGIKIVGFENDVYYYTHKMFAKKMRIKDRAKEVNKSKLSHIKYKKKDNFAFEPEDSNYYINNEIVTRSRYSESYAQAIEGWSDQAIDEVFEGDPSLYWNID